MVFEEQGISWIEVFILYEYHGGQPRRTDAKETIEMAAQEHQPLHPQRDAVVLDARPTL